MCSSLTLLSAEIEGRAYGGGVLKVETREAERLIIPALDSSTSLILEEMLGELDELIRRGEVERAAEAADSALRFDHERLWRAYIVFRERRLGRRRADLVSPDGGG